MRKILLTLILFTVLFFASTVLSKNAFAAGEFGNTNPNFNYSGYPTYNMGYRFQPKTNGNITQLWCAGSGGGTSTVKLWDEANTATPLATATITCTGGAWISANITPVAVLSTKTYRVAQYGSSSYWTSLIPSATNINILDGVYISGTSNYPSSNGGGYIYGYADVTFALAGPTVTTSSSFSYSYNYVQPNGTINPGSSSTIYYGSSYGVGSGYSATPCSSLPNKTGTIGPLTANSGTNTVYPTFTASPSTLYYFCVWAYDSSNATYYYSSNTYSVTTSAIPTPAVSIYPAFLVENTVANLAAGVMPYGISSSGFFRYGTAAQYTAGGSTCSGLPTTTTNTSTGSSSGNYYPITAKITGLSPSTTYYFCFQDLGSGTGYSPVSSFTTTAAVNSGCSLLPGSSIATAGNATTLAGYLGSNNFQGTKIYQATVNGWTAANFHTAANNQGETVTIIRNSINGKIFGGYSPQAWTSSGSYKAGAGAFLFSFSDGYKLMQQNYADYMINDNASYGSTFGGGHDLALSANPLNAAGVNYTTPWVDYENPSSKGAFTYLDGGGGSPSANNFTANEIEVYKLSVCTITGPASVTTTAVSAVISGGASENQAKLNGTVNPNGFATTGWFRYQANTNPGSCNDTFGTRLPASGEVTVGSGSTSVAIPTQTTLATLTPNTTYYYCAIAKGNGITVPASNVLSFITAPQPPTGITPSTTTPPGIRNITWNASAGADRYYIRIDDTVDGWTPPPPGGCDNGTTPNSGDVCQYTSNTFYSYNFIAGHTYNIWIHSYNTSVPTTSNSTNITVTTAYPLNVSKSFGTGSSASVTSLDGFINCGATCSYSYTTNASVKLTANPDAVSQLTGWSGVICTGAGESQTTTTCTFNVGSITGLNNTVTANFTKITYLLTVAKNGGAAGLGSGTVQSTVSGTPDSLINCGSTCSHSYDINTQVTLKETPDATATFAAWSGASCLEGNQTSNVCTVFMDAAKTVTANFNSIGYTGDATFYFGSPGQTCSPNNGSKTTPALEVVVITGSTSSPTVSKYFFDPCNRVGGSTGLVTALNSTTGLYQGVTFAYKATVPAITHGLIMKVIPLYNSSIVGVQGTDIFPPQGKVIQSTGSSGDTARKVIYYESYPQIPNEIFPYSILSQ